ncbi:nucleotidyltransferase [Lentilactobacillus sp. IMAU92037]|uniref:nucleotidyltransferase n=1 Tax=Lentilactobacillus dabitei TaxID=2831523 RepID=UPI001C2C9410|nr:nucleotidyltransferase [Lentilactobacillus dabitei]MBV0929823.1 nucleotidyltransferase [Lentilactobacillus dabitei]
MLHAVGIVSEYNPFHNGHLYHLQQAKVQTGANVSIAIMSGNWLQRGEPAIFDKWQRTKLALDNGIDIVVELPFFSAVQPSHIFASGAVALAADLQCDWLSFGAENPSIDYQELIDNQPRHDKSFKQFDRPYPSIFQDYLFKKTGIRLNQPNDMLAFGYANANFNLGAPLKLVPVKRIGSCHNDRQIDSSSSTSSGSAIRTALLAGNSTAVARFVPTKTQELIQVQQLMTWDQFWPMLRFELVETPINELHNIYQMTEGIEYRLKRCAIKATSFRDFLRLVKTKRYTYTRIQRLCTYVLVHAYPQDMLVKPSYIRLLGFSRNGRIYLNQVKKQLSLPLITKINEDVVQDYIEMDFKSGMLFQMINQVSQDFYKHPIIR